MHPLTGYVDRWSARQGRPIRFMISSAGGRDFDLRFVRHTCTDPNPRGPGYAETAMASPIDGRIAGREQPAFLGSFGHVAALTLPGGALTIEANVWPTTPAKGRQGIVALALGDWTLSLNIGPGGGAMIEAKGPHGTVAAEIARPEAAGRFFHPGVQLTAPMTGVCPATNTRRISQVKNRLLIKPFRFTGPEP